MFIHFYKNGNYNKNSLIIKVSVNCFVYMNDNMYDENFCAYKILHEK
jgi:hypothetical protein